MSDTLTAPTALLTTNDAPLDFVREKLTKKAITADHPTWCPGCPESFRGPRP